MILHGFRDELKKKYSMDANAKIDEDYNRTKNDYYRMDLDQLEVCIEYKAALSVFYCQQVLRHLEIVSDKNKNSLPAFICIFSSDMPRKNVFNLIGI